MNYLENCKAALEAWQTVPRDKVQLSHWRCGTIHCFGGWLPHFKYFQKLGVYSIPASGAPYMRGNGPYNLMYGEVAQHLFGDMDMFDEAQPGELGSDWNIVDTRLRNRIKELT